MTAFEIIFEDSPIILTGGPLLERLKREFKMEIDHDQLSLSELIYTHPTLLENLYRQYLDIARSHDLPLFLLTPTNRITPELLKTSKYGAS